MSRDAIMHAVELAHAAAHNATLARAYHDHDLAKARHYAREADAALYMAIDALSQSRLANLSDQYIAARAAQQERLVA